MTVVSVATPGKGERATRESTSGGDSLELTRGFEGDAVDEAEGTLAGDGGLCVVADDIEGDLTEPFAVEQVGQRNHLDWTVCR